MAIREIRFSQSALLKILKDIFGAASPAGSTSTTSDDTGISERPISDYEILERWDSILLELKRSHLHLFLLTGFDGIELDPSFIKPIRAFRQTVGVAEDEDLADLLYVREEQTSGTHAGTFTSGDWRIRVLNTVVTNEISGSSLASNQITLPAGTYEIFAQAPAVRTNEHKLKLYDVTNTADLIIGSSEYVDTGTQAGGNQSFVFGRFELSGDTDLELRHQCSLTVSTFGFGIASGYSVVEVYAEARIKKLA